MRDREVVAAAHEPSSRRIAELINSAIVAGDRFMAPICVQKLELETVHQPRGSEDDCGLHEVRNYRLLVRGRQLLFHGP